MSLLFSFERVAQGGLHRFTVKQIYVFYVTFLLFGNRGIH